MRGEKDSREHGGLKYPSKQTLLLHSFHEEGIQGQHEERPPEQLPSSV